MATMERTALMRAGGYDLREAPADGLESHRIRHDGDTAAFLTGTGTFHLSGSSIYVWTRTGAMELFPGSTILFDVAFPVSWDERSGDILIGHLRLETGWG